MTKRFIWLILTERPFLLHFCANLRNRLGKSGGPSTPTPPPYSPMTLPLAAPHSSKMPKGTISLKN